jgi:uncharacterized protein (DUF58 family)
MPSAAASRLAPQTLAGLKNLTLIAKTVVDGFMLGSHKSLASGGGLEFSEYRSYQSGDDARRIDWKMYSRSDKLFIRESEIETSISVRVILDISASMLHSEDGISKHQYATFLAAAIAYLAEKQGDSIGLYAINDRVIHLPARRSPQQVAAFIHTLETLKPSGTWANWETLSPILAASKQRELTVFISDMHELTDEVFTALTKYRALKNDVLLCHLVGRRELTLDYGNGVTLEDLETGEQTPLTADAKKNYIAALNTRHESLRLSLLSSGIDYHQFIIQEPLDAALREFLSRRGR